MTGSLARRSYIRVFLAAALLSIVGCATQIAPPYDRDVAEGLAAANIEAMILMAAASQGTEKGTFTSREDKYNALIGKLEALALSAGARPMPKNKVTEAINKLLEKRGGQAIDDDEATPPSAHSIKKIAGTLTKMRNTDKMQGVTVYEAEAFKGQLIIYFDQAITYETFLQR